MLPDPGPGMVLVYLLHFRTLSQAWLMDVFPLAGGPTPGGGAPWHLRNVLSDSVESSDDEFFDARGESTPSSHHWLGDLSGSTKKDSVGA